MKYGSKILLIDNNPAFLRLIIESIVDQDNKSILDNILISENAEDSIRKYIQYKPLLVLLDIRLPGKNGIDIAKEIRHIDKNANIIFLSNYPKDPDAAELVSKRLVMGTMDKGIGTDFLASFIGFIIKIGAKAI